MAVTSPPQPTPAAATRQGVMLRAVSEPYRFVFENVDRAFYERVDAEVGPGVFVTYHQGTLELVTTSLLHDRTSRVLYRLVCILAEEGDVPTCSAGSATLRDPGGDAVQGDEAFYFGDNVARMLPRIDSGSLIDFSRDPPPDLAIEVEVTSRLGGRVDVYRQIGVPEVWRYDGTLTVLALDDGVYRPCDRSPRFPHLSPHEIAGFVAAGVRTDETTLARQFRARVRETLGH